MTKIMSVTTRIPASITPRVVLGESACSGARASAMGVTPPEVAAAGAVETPGFSLGTVIALSEAVCSGGLVDTGGALESALAGGFGLAALFVAFAPERKDCSKSAGMAEGFDCVP